MTTVDERPARPLAVVTGAASGIGEACVGLLIDRGWSVIAIDIDAAGLHRGRTGPWSGSDVRTITADLRDTRGAIAAIEGEIEADRPVDALLNIAGMYHETTVADFDPEIALDILRVNTLAPQALSYALWNRFAKNGCIVNAGSQSIGVYIPDAVTYTASKGGLAALTFAMQGAAGDSGLRIYCINFGQVRTPMYEAALKEEVPYATPEETAEEVFACIEGGRRGREGIMYPFTSPPKTNR